MTLLLLDLNVIAAPLSGNLDQLLLLNVFDGQMLILNVFDDQMLGFYVIVAYLIGYCVIAAHLLISNKYRHPAWQLGTVPDISLLGKVVEKKK